MESKTVCRFCLKSCETIFKDVQALTLEMLGYLGLELQLNVSEKPVICKTCSENLQKCFDFKTACLHTEDCIKSCRNGGNNVKLDLREIYARKNKNENNLRSECDICRLCMEMAESGCYVSLNGKTGDIISAEAILREYFSELDLKITNNPVICTSCNDYLRVYLSFIKTCLDVKDKVKRYCEIEECIGNTQMELNSVLPFEAEYTSNNENSYNDIATFENCNDNELYGETKFEPENLMQKKPQGLHVKREVIDDEVKIEELNDIIGKCDEDEQNYEGVVMDIELLSNHFTAC